jgi:hypothetical protein
MCYEVERLIAPGKRPQKKGPQAAVGSGKLCDTFAVHERRKHVVLRLGELAEHKPHMAETRDAYKV